MTALPPGITLRKPGDQIATPWSPGESHQLLLEAIAAEGRTGTPIPRHLEVELNAAVTRRDLAAVRAWSQRIVKALETA